MIPARLQLQRERAEIREQLERIQRRANLLRAKESLSDVALIIYDNDPKGESYIPRDDVFEELSAGLDDAPENIQDLIDAAIKSGEIEQTSQGLALTRRTWRALGN